MKKWIAGMAVSLLPYVAFAAEQAAKAADAAAEEPTGTPWGGLVVIGVIALLASMVTIGGLSVLNKAKIKRCQAELAQLKSAIDYYKAKKGMLRQLVKEAGVGMVRSTPVNMKSTTNVKAKNAPGSAHAMQHAADARRIQLDRQAQKLKDQLKRQRETEIARRKNANNL